MFILITNFISNRVDYNARLTSPLMVMNEISLPNFNLINFKKIARFKMSDNRDPEGVPVKLKKNL